MHRHTTLYTGIWVSWCYLLLVTVFSLARHSGPMPTKLVGVSFATYSSEVEPNADDPYRKSVLAVPLQLEWPPEEPLDVTWRVEPTFADGVASVPRKTSSVRFQAAQAKQFVFVEVDWHALSRVTELELIIEPAENYRPVGGARHKLTLLPTPALNYELSIQEAREGRDSNVELLAQLSRPLRDPLTLDFYWTGRSNVDKFVKMPRGPVVIAAGGTKAVINMDLPDNRDYDGDQSLRLTLRKTSLRGLQTRPRGIFFRHIDDEKPATISLAFGSSEKSLNEAGSNPGVTVVGTLQGMIPDKELRVPLRFSGSATEDVDFEAKKELVFAKGSLNAEVNFFVLPDKLHEPDENIVVEIASSVGVSQSGDPLDIRIIDDDMVALLAEVMPLGQVLYEGDAKQNRIRISIAPTLEVPPGKLTDTPVRFEIKPSQGVDSIGVSKRLTVHGATRIDSERHIFEVRLNDHGKAEAAIEVLNDKVYTGTSELSLLLATRQPLTIVGHGPHLFYIQDDEPLPVTLSINGDNAVVDASGKRIIGLSEAKPDEKATLTLTMQAPLPDAIDVPLVFFGPSDANDIRMGSHAAIVPLQAQEVRDLRLIRFPANTKSLSIPLFAVDDEEFEGDQLLKIRLTRSESADFVQLRIYDDDACKIAVNKAPIDLTEGECGTLSIALTNAPFGLAAPFGLSFDLGENSTATIGEDVKFDWDEPVKDAEGNDVPFSYKEFSYPERKQYLKLRVTTVQDRKTEGQELLYLNLRTTGGKRLSVTQPTALIRVSDAKTEKAIVAIAINPRWNRLWEELRVPLQQFVRENHQLLFAGSIHFIGKNGNICTWDGESESIGVEPFDADDAWTRLQLVLQQIQKLLKENTYGDAFLLWAADSATGQAQARLKLNPRLRTHVLLYPAENDEAAGARDFFRQQLAVGDPNFDNQVTEMSLPPQKARLVKALNELIGSSR